MFSSKWRRPKNVNYPQVWSRFERTMKDGRILKFKIQDLTEDRYDEALDFMIKHYLKYEAWNSNAGVCDDPMAIEAFKELVRQTIFPQKVVIMCTIDDDTNDKPELIGCNLLGVCEKSEPIDFTPYIALNSDSINMLLTIFKVYKDQCPDVYEKYNVDEYLGAFGLSVHCDYRGYGISVDMLKARIPLLKAIGLKVTSTDFTGTASQKSARKVGFKSDLTLSYDVIRDVTNLEFKGCVNCEMLSLVLS